MSGQLIELIIFAGIAFFIINKLISTLGNTNEDDSSSKTNMFNKSNISGKEIDGIARKVKTFKPKFNAISVSKLKGFVVEGQESSVLEGINEVLVKFPQFDFQKFIKISKIAFDMIIRAGNDNRESDLVDLVDKRYMEIFSNIKYSYGEIQDIKKLKSEISEIYSFGNNIFVKIVFSGSNIVNKIPSLQEEWTFTKNVLTEGPEWHLTNIDKI